MTAITALVVLADAVAALVAAHIAVFRATTEEEASGRRVPTALLLGLAAAAVWCLLGLIPGLRFPTGAGMPPAGLLWAIIPCLERGALWAVAIWPLSIFLLQRRLGVRLDAATSVCTEVWLPTVVTFVIIEAVASLVWSMMKAG
jgi:hypothetical protein